MATAYQHRPMSSILAPTADPKAEGQNTDQPRDDVTGQFVSPDVAPAPVPDKYAGKSTEEVIAMHQNLEREYGRQANEVGTYRGLVNDLTQLQRTPVESQPVVQEPIDVSGDDLMQRPVETVRKIVKQDLDALKRPPETVANDATFEIEGRALMASFPDLDKIVADPKFQAFASRTPSRQQDFQTAATGKGVDQVRAARRLMEDYTDFEAQSTVIPDSGPTPTEQARAVATEGSGSTGAVSTKPQLYESDVIALINSDPAKYRSPSFQAELMLAIKEKRYVKTG